MEEFLGIVAFEATMHIKYVRWRLERCWCAKESLKTLLIDMLWL